MYIGNQTAGGNSWGGWTPGGNKDQSKQNI